MTKKPKFIEPEMINIIHQKPEKSMTIQMVHLPKGKFIFGEGNSVEEVIIDYEFEIGKYAVTFEEYDAFCEDENRKKPKDQGWGRGKRPVINVSWSNAVAYCRWLSEKTKQNYRLPTEKEWEYACRAGTTTKWSFGDDDEELIKYAWYDKNSNKMTHPIGEKFANPWGIYDMHGNVWEWCQDWYDYPKKEKVLRGGSWKTYFGGTESADYKFWHLYYGSYDRGFRLLRTLP